MSDDNDDLVATIDVADDLPEGQTAGDDADPSDAIEGGPASFSDAQGSRRSGRSVSEKTRQLFAKASAALRPQLGDYGDGDMEPALEVESDSPEPAAAPHVAGQPSVTSTAPTAPAAAPAPSLDPAVAQERQKLIAAREEFEKRSAEVEAQARSSDLVALGDKYFADPNGAVVDLLKRWTGAATDDDVKGEITDLITSLSQMLGVPLTDATKQALEGKRVLKQAKRELAKVGTREQQIEARAQEAETARQRQVAERAIGQALAAPEHVKAFPWLAAEEDAASLIVDVYNHALKTEGKQIHWTEAARRANDHLQKQSTAWHDRRKHLFTAAPAQPAAPAANATRAPAAAQAIRSTRAVTNAQASATTTPPPSNPALVDGKFSMEAHRAASRRKMRSAFATRPADE
jgi:hypothetical protein